MAIYELSADSFRRIPETTFREQGLQERQDLQRLLRTQIDIIAPGTLVIAEEFGSSPLPPRDTARSFRAAVSLNRHRFPAGGGLARLVPRRCQGLLPAGPSRAAPLMNPQR